MKGDYRVKSRAQGQDQRVYLQQSFGGGQNSDTPPGKIAPSEVALLRNAVAYPDRLEGGAGARLASDEVLPGSGAVHSLEQHPATGRWLLHRGSQFWLSAGRVQREWSEVESLGPGGALTATGEATVEVATFTGDAAANLSNPFVELSSTPPSAWDVVITEGSGGGFTIGVINPDTMSTVAEYTGNASDQPIVGAEFTNLLGVNLTCDIDGIPVSGYGTITGGLDRTPTDVDVDFSLRGLSETNTDSFSLWGRITQNSDRTRTFRLYKNSVRTDLVASGSSPGVYYTGAEISGISNDAPLAIVGEYDISQVTFTPATEAAIDDSSRITFFQDYGFIVHVASAEGATVFVDQRTNSRHLLSTEAGYPTAAAVDVGSGAYKRRYLQTFSRIVDPITGIPSSSLDRVSGSLVFEGPSNVLSGSATDYCTGSASSPIGDGGSVNLSLASASGPLITEGAAGYITHVSIYGTKDVGENNPIRLTVADVYVWIADIPISSIQYTDQAEDALLDARLKAGGFLLQSRGWRQMDRGVGCIRPDFMFTAFIGGTSLSYCDVRVVPRLIGYHNPLQRIVLQDPVTHIEKTTDQMVVLCPSSTYTYTTGIYQDVGTQGVFIPQIVNQLRVSGNVGVSSEVRPFVIDESGFVAFCTDHTIRQFSYGAWGRPLDGNVVHKILERARQDCVLGFIRGCLLFWFTDGERRRCLRYSFDGNTGIRWSEIEREAWPVATAAAVYEDDASLLRLVVIDADTGCFFSVEDEAPGRVYEDEVPGAAPVLRGTTALSNIVIDNWFPVTLYGGFQGGYIGLFDSEAARDAWSSPIGIAGPVTEPAAGVEIYGSISGTIDVLSTSIGNFTVVDGIGIAALSRIDSAILFRELGATRPNFTVMHESSFVGVRSPYGMPAPQVRATWFGDEVAQDASVIVPANGSIQSFKRIEGKRIQLGLEFLGSGWQIDEYETKYQTHDVRGANGPWNSPEAAYQAALAFGLVAWMNGESRLRNRVGGAFTGTPPDATEDPSGDVLGQDFSEPVEFASSMEFTDYTLMFWAKNPTIGAQALDAAPLSMVYGDLAVAFALFTDPSVIDCGPFQYALPSPCNDGEWHHYAVVRDGEGFRVFQDGIKIGEDSLAQSSYTVGVVRVGSPEGPQNLFSPRAYTEALADEAVAYYYSNPDQWP